MEQSRKAHFVEKLSQRVIDQPEGVECAAGFLLRHHYGLVPKGKPLDTMLFMGPTGVGKTELSLAIADLGFQGSLERCDMSEYGTVDTMPLFVNRLMLLSEQSGVLLFDEIEKAHPTLLKLMLQILDTARLRNPADGAIGYFHNFLIIGTSNVASAELAELNHSAHDVMTEFVMKRASTFFAPEVLARWRNKVVFRVLSARSQRIICDTKLETELQYVKEKTGLDLQVHGTLVDYLNEHGINRVFGARPLLQMIENTIWQAAANFLDNGGTASRHWIGIAPDGSVAIRSNDLGFGRELTDVSVRSMLQV